MSKQASKFPELSDNSFGVYEDLWMQNLSWIEYVPKKKNIEISIELYVPPISRQNRLSFSKKKEYKVTIYSPKHIPKTEHKLTIDSNNVITFACETDGKKPIKIWFQYSYGQMLDDRPDGYTRLVSAVLGSVKTGARKRKRSTK